MLPESWQAVEQLLLLCSTVQQSDLAALDSALQVIRQSLPTAHITVLLMEQSNYRYAPIATDLSIWIQQTNPVPYEHDITLIEQIRAQAYDGAIVFTAPEQSPYALAYYCYLAGIPLRLGQSQEFGGRVLSHSIQPPVEAGTSTDYYLHLLKSIGFLIPESVVLAIA